MPLRSPSSVVHALGRALLLVVVLGACRSAALPPLLIGPGRTDVTASAGAVVHVEAGPEDAAAGDEWLLRSVTPTGAIAELDKRRHLDEDECEGADARCTVGSVYFVVRLAADLSSGTTVRFVVDNCARGTCPGEGAQLVGPEARVRYLLTITP